MSEMGFVIMINVNSILGNNVVINSTVAKTAATSSAFSQAFSGATQNSMDDIFKAASEKYSISETLLKAVAQAESNFDTNAVSRCGAQGVMQLMPETASYLGVSDPFDAQQNIMGGAKYLSGLLNQYDGDVKLALAAYNAGSGNVDKYGGVPPFEETQNYVVKVMGLAGQNISVPNNPVTGNSGVQSTEKSTTGRVYSATSDTSKMIEDILGFSGFSQDDYGMFIKLFLTAIMMPKADATTSSQTQGIANQWLSDLNKSRVVNASSIGEVSGLSDSDPASAQTKTIADSLYNNTNSSMNTSNNSLADIIGANITGVRT